MSRHRRRPPIRLRRQWEREAAAWWSEHAVPTVLSQRVYAGIARMDLLAWSLDGGFRDVHITGTDADGHPVEETMRLPVVPICPVRTLPRR